MEFPARAFDVKVCVAHRLKQTVGQIAGVKADVWLSDNLAQGLCECKDRIERRPQTITERDM